MKRTLQLVAAFTIVFFSGFALSSVLAQQGDAKAQTELSSTTTQTVKPLNPGVFSMSLSVKDLGRARSFYETLGFNAFGGSMKQNYVIMKNGNTLIGLFKGMFQGNVLTFNPGWDENAKNVDPFDDVRSIQQALLAKGITLTLKADEKTSGPASIMLSDPDGNMILVDQHR